jgi:glycosyltransferase involved in cell wall biosynthesis
MLGSTIITSLLPFFMLFLRIFGKSNVVVLHQVIGDLSLLGEHVDIKAKSFKNWFFSNGIRWFYRLTGLFVNHIIVHEQFLKKELTQWVNPEKITVISHGMDLEKPIMRYRKNARIKFGYTKNDFVVLLFGYINWYKGTDWIIKRIGNLYQRNPKLNIKLLVAGGPSVTLESKSHYRRFLAKVEDLAATYNKSVTMAGFVAENDVKKYFAAADLVVLPYRVMISASGPLSFALRFNRPLLLSEKLNHAFDNADAATVLKSINAKPEDFTFNMQGQGFNKRLTLLAKDKKKLANLNKYPKHLRYLRRWENIVIQYSRVIDNNLNTVPVFKLTRGLIELAPAPLMLMTSVQKRG